MAAEAPSQNSPKAPSTDLDARRIGAVLEHIELHGNLDGFPADRAERLALVSTARRQGLVVWNSGRKRYELTGGGHRRLRSLRRAGRTALQDRPGGVVRSGMNAIVTAAGAVLVCGALFFALKPAQPLSVGPASRAGGQSSVGTASRSAQTAPDAPPADKMHAGVVTTEAMAHERKPALEPNSDLTRVGDASSPAADQQAAKQASAPAERSAADVGVTAGTVPSTKRADRDTERTAAKQTHKQKRTTRRRETPPPGYAYEAYPSYSYGSYGSSWGTRNSRYWSASPWAFR